MEKCSFLGGGEDVCGAVYTNPAVEGEAEREELRDNERDEGKCGTHRAGEGGG